MKYWARISHSPTLYLSRLCEALDYDAALTWCQQEWHQLDGTPCKCNYFSISQFVISIHPADSYIAILTKPNLPTFMESVEDLISQNTIQWGIRKGTTYETIGRDSPPGSTLRCPKWSQLMITSLNSNDCRIFHEHAVRHQGSCDKLQPSILKGDYACVQESLVGRMIISENFKKSKVCNVYMTTKKHLYSPNHALAFPVGIS